MNKEPSLSDVIALIKTQLIAADTANQDTGLSIDSAKISLGFSITQDDSGKPLISYSSTDNETHGSQITLKFSSKKKAVNSAEFQLVEEDEDEFERFKKNFDASVQRKHAQPGIKKKNIFESD